MTTLAVSEYKALSWFGRLNYRLHGHPAIMFGIGPARPFLFKQRLPFGMMRAGSLPWISAMATNLAITVIAAILIWAIGSSPSCWCICRSPCWPGRRAYGFSTCSTSSRKPISRKSQNGSFHMQPFIASHYDLPLALRWVTGNISIHHVHHLSSRAPYCRLPEALRDHPNWRVSAVAR
ncbi:hypothetical protein [Rhizobium leucaenae]|uniref:hypothetical protein n=1 Tax=Rhizobium leucaenae TaxID=29450 RepID=UPI003CCA5F72